MRGDRGDRAGQADERCGASSSGTACAARSIAASMSAIARRDLARGRRVAAQVPLGHPHAADVDRAARRRAGRCRATNSVEPPPMSTTRYGVGDRAPRRARASRRRRTARASSSPVTTSGSTPRRSRTPATNVVAVARVAGAPTSRRSAPARRRARAIDVGVAASHAAKVRSSAASDEPAGAVDALAEPHDLHPARRGRRASRPRGRRRRRAAGSSWCRSRSAATRVTARPRRRRTGRAAHQSGSSASASSPSGLTPGPAASAWPTSTCRHFTRSGMPPARDAVDLRDVEPDLGARVGGEVVLVRGRGSAPRRSSSVAPAARCISRISPDDSSVLDRRRSRAGRSGSRASGTACRPSSRGAVSTTSGAPHGQRCATPRTPRGGRPSWACDRGDVGRRLAIVGASITSLASDGCVRRRRRRARRPPATEPHSFANHASSARDDGLLRRRRGRLVRAEHDVAGLARHDEVQPRAGLRLDVGRVLPAAACAALSAATRCSCCGGARAQLGEVGPLREVRAQRHDRREHQRGERRARARRPGRSAATGAARRCRSSAPVA